MIPVHASAESMAELLAMAAPVHGPMTVELESVGTGAHVYLDR